MQEASYKGLYQQAQYLYEKYFGKDFAVALKHTEEMLKIAFQLSDKIKVAEAYYAMSRVLWRLGNFKEAIKTIKQITTLIETRSESWNAGFCAKVYNLLGIVYKKQGEYEHALLNYFKSVELIKEREEEFMVDLAGTYMNIANVYLQNLDYDDSLVFLEKAYWLMRKQDSPKGILYCLNLFGNIYGEKGEIDEAKYYYTECLKLLNKHPDPSRLAITYNNLSIISERTDDFENALEYCFKSLAIKQSLKASLPLAISFHRIGYIYTKMGNFQDGLDNLKKALDLTLEIGAKGEAVPILKKMADAYQQLGDYQRAYEKLTAYTELRNEVFTDEKARNIAEMQTKFEVKQKERETELLRQKQTEIQRYAERLEESNQELENFAKVTSHDLKEPLRMINSYMKLIERKVRPMNDESLNLFLHYAIDGAVRMEQLINDVLDLAKVTTNKKPFEEIDLNDMMYMIERNLSQFLLEKNAKIECPNLPNIKGDQSQITQLFQNLISNGIKYNDKEVPIMRISVEESENTFKFIFTDNGIGIKKEFYERIFQMLQRLHTKKKYSGTGIGLAIVKKIAERHGGRISVSSVFGEGSTFYFTIPKEPTEQ